MRRRLSYANITATLALVFAMSGGALAANHYLISSTKQINPKVLKKLKGKAGAKGAPGAIGATGAPGPGGREGPQGKAGSSKEGPQGKEGSKGEKGEPGPLLTTLPSGKTVTGGWGAGYTAANAGDPYFATTTFPIALAVSAEKHHLRIGCLSTSLRWSRSSGQRVFVCIPGRSL